MARVQNMQETYKESLVGKQIIAGIIVDGLSTVDFVVDLGWLAAKLVDAERAYSSIGQILSAEIWQDGIIERCLGW